MKWNNFKGASEASAPRTGRRKLRQGLSGEVCMRTASGE